MFPVTVLVATPADAVKLPAPLTLPEPAVWAKLMLRELSAPVVIVLPPASSIVAVNVRVEPDTRVVVAPESTIWDAVPTLTLNTLLSAAVSTPSVAWSLYPVPAVSILQPEKLTTPLVSLCAQPESVPGPPDAGVPDVIDRPTVDESGVTTLPNASSIATFGWVANATLPVLLLGCCVKASFAGEAAETETVAEPVAAVCTVSLTLTD
jgi:hypothetical protein